MLLTELPARKAAGLRPGAADAKSTDMDAGEPGSDGPMSMSMLCIDTCMHTKSLNEASESNIPFFIRANACQHPKNCLETMLA